MGGKAKKITAVVSLTGCPCQEVSMPYLALKFTLQLAKGALRVSRLMFMSGPLETIVPYVLSVVAYS